jgi:sphingomyelin phosphodiesterase acid-like 3
MRSFLTKALAGLPPFTAIVATRCANGVTVTLAAASIAAMLLVTGGAPSGADTGAPPALARWILLSDIHFTPYADARLVDALVAAPASRWRDILRRGGAAPSRYGEDTNFALLESALDEMHRVEPDPPVVVIAGDFLAHEFPETFAKLEPGQPPAAFDAFVDKTISFLALEANARFPHAHFVVTIGNNDGYCGDYRSTPNSAFFAHFAEAWGPLVDRGGAAPGFPQTFSTGGYYAAQLPGDGRIVSLNSVFWSLAYQNACGNAADDPGAAELRWLDGVAAGRAGRYRWVLAHIPPAMDAYDSMQTHVPVSFLRDLDTTELLDALTGPALRPSAIILGHTHHPSFPVFGTGAGAVPGIVLGSISPVQGNNPSFTTAEVDARNGTIRDLSAYALLLGGASPAWTKEYDFQRLYGVAALDAPSLLRVHDEVGANPLMRAAFAAYYTSFSLLGGIDPATWRWYWCADAQFAAAGYAACAAGNQTL